MDRRVICRCLGTWISHTTTKYDNENDLVDEATTNAKNKRAQQRTNYLAIISLNWTLEVRYSICGALLPFSMQ
jgi:hypothetical protein